MARTRIVACFSAFLLLGGGCGKSTDESAGAPVTSPETAEKKAASPALAEVNASLKAGAFDDAAAGLLALQSSGHEFSSREAGDYRRAMNDAYTRSLEAAEKGDQRAAAAIQMLRAAKAR